MSMSVLEMRQMTAAPTPFAPTTMDPTSVAVKRDTLEIVEIVQVHKS